MFELSLIGGCALFGPDRQHIRIANKKASALFAHLAMTATGVETREKLAGLLWSESSEAQARASLRQCLKQLRTIFDKVGFDGFETDRTNVVLSRENLRVDVIEVEAALAKGDVPEPLLSPDAAAERMLYGYESLDQLYTNWLRVMRQQFHNTWFDLLQTTLREAVQPSKSIAEALIALDPTHEEAHRALIEHFANDGNMTAAMDQYSKLWTLLDEEYDAEPSDATQALIVDIKSGTFRPKQFQPEPMPEPAPVAAAPTRQPLNIPIIGIRPFDKAGPWEGEDYLIEGFRRELAGALSKFREWSVFEFTGEQSVDDAIAQMHSAGTVGYLYVLEGTYFEIEGKIYQTITLKQAATSKYVWSEQIDLNMQSWFAARRQLLQRLAGALNIYLSVDRQQQIVGEPSVSLDLYDKWLKGQALMFEWTPENDAEAAELFEQVIEGSPTFASAYASLVAIENGRILVTPGAFPIVEREQRALDLAKRAVQLDPVDTKTHLALAWSYAMNRQYDLAEMSYRLAYELNKNDSWTLISVATGLSFCGQYEEALELAEQALELDLSPSASHWLYQSTVRYLAGRTEEAAEMSVRAEGITHGSLAWHAAMLVELGDLDGARTMADRFKQRCLGNWQGDEAPTETSPGDWAISIYPIKDNQARQRLRDGMAKAGIPTSG